jgi:hypothetical protein
MIIVILFVPVKRLDRARIAGLVLLSVAALAYTGILINDYNSGDERHGARTNTVNDSSTGGGGVSEDVNVCTNGVIQIPHRRGTSATAEMKHSLSPPHRSTTSDRGREKRKFDGRIVVTLIVIMIFSTASIVNTELLRIKNGIKFQDDDWSFGQVSELV